MKITTRKAFVGLTAVLALTAAGLAATATEAGAEQTSIRPASVGNNFAM